MERLLHKISAILDMRRKVPAEGVIDMRRKEPASNIIDMRRKEPAPGVIDMRNFNTSEYNTLDDYYKEMGWVNGLPK